MCNYYVYFVAVWLCFVTAAYGQSTVNEAVSPGFTTGTTTGSPTLQPGSTLQVQFQQLSQQLLTQLRQETQQTVNNIQTQTDVNQRSINILLAQSQTQYDELKEAAEQDRAIAQQDRATIQELKQENQVKYPIRYTMSVTV